MNVGRSWSETQLLVEVGYRAWGSGLRDSGLGVRV